MTDQDLATLTRLVLGAGFALSVALGVLAQHTRFCTMGAVADVVHLGDWGRARMWALAIGVAVLGFNGLVALGWLLAADSLYAGTRLNWLSAAVGGVMFGAGMVLASGCASKNLLRAGTGNLKAVVVLGVVAFSGLATLKGVTAVARGRWLDAVAVELPAGQDLPTLLALWGGWPVPATAGVLALVVGGGLIVAALAPREGRTADLLLGGVGVGLCVVLAWWVSGRLGFVPEHPQTLESVHLATLSRRMEALSFVAGIASASDYLQYFSDSTRLANLGMVSAAGVLTGALLHALATRSFRWEGFRATDDLGRHLLGGALMGVGGVTALGCSFGQGLSGISTLSLGSAIALTAMVTGAVAMLRWQAWRLEQA
jgi:uncharacterized protein